MLTIVLLLFVVTALLLAFFITLLLQAKAALREKEEDPERLFSLSPTLLCIVSHDGKIIRLNPAWKTMLGYGPDELAGRMMIDLVHPEDIGATGEAITALGKGKEIVGLSVRYRCKDGSFRWIEWRSRSHLASLSYLFGRDITEWKQTEALLQKVSSSWKLAQGMAKIGCWSYSIETRQFHCSEQMLLALGHDPSKYTLEYPNIKEVIHQDDRGKFESAFQDAIKGGRYNIEIRTVFPDRPIHWWQTQGEPRFDQYGNVVELFGIAQDITDRKRTEETLRFTQYAIDKTIDQAFWTTEDGSLFYVNDAACRSLGYSREELLQLSIPDIGPTFPPEVFARHWRDLQKNGSATFESFHRAKDGRVYPVEIRANYVVFDGREYNCAFATDITGRKQMEQSLRESESFQRVLLQAIPDLIWLKDANGVFLACNAMFERLYGAKEADVVGKTDYDFVDKPLADFFREHDRIAIAAGKPTSNEESVVFADDGHIALLETVKTPMFDDQGKLIGVLGVARDITERKNAEEEKAKLKSQLQQAQKMESVGRLAGGVAHDFNNMLGVILGYGELALQQADADQQLHAALQQIIIAAQHSADITRQLLAFARKQTISPKILDMNKAVESMIKMLQRLIGEDIDLAWLPGMDVWTVMIDPGQIDQILANLCVNARDAISDVGKVTIETGNAEFDEAYCSYHYGFQPGEYVFLTVSDNGCGMDPKTLDHIFEPFFTTKASSGGTGLGLATVYGIVHQNNGFINVYSEPGQGTTFKIYLPRHQVDAGFFSEKLSQRPVKHGHETILLVEDEPMILDLVTMMLETLGYTVLAARTPGGAIKIAQEHAGEIHLLLTDVIMPEMNGRDLAKGILAVYANLKVLFMSGYTANVIAHHGVLDGGVHFIQKPFSRETLAAKVREALEGEAA